MSNNAVSEEKTRGFWRNVKNNLLGPEDVYIPSYMEEKPRNNQRKVRVVMTSNRKRTTD